MAVEVMLPIHGDGHDFLPVIFTQQEKDATLDLKALIWARELTLAYGLPSIQQRIKTITRFMNFYGLFAAGERFGIEEQTQAIYAYLDWRINGTKSLPSHDKLHLLDWPPVQKATVRNEFRHIVEYFTFLEEEYNGGRMLNERSLSIPSKTIKSLTLSKSTDFFSHLAKSRRYWKDHRPGSSHVPRWVRPDSQKPQFRPFAPLEEVREIVFAERNPVFRAIWLAAAFGSHRISELLHVWQIDILPGSYRSEFFGPGLKDETTLLLMAHPSDSTYLDQSNSTQKITRQTYLDEKYNMTPRNLLPERHPMRSGWKSKLLHGYQLTGNTFWLDRSAERCFRECVEEIQQFHLSNRTSRRHPYFFVNMLSKDNTFGEPLRMARIQKAWVAACHRVGIAPHVRGRNIHGLRHLAKWIAETIMNLGPSDIQIIRGDRSVKSQNDYARCAQSVHDHLAENLLTDGNRS
ncbi:hypothetical protein R3X27_12635 [Tropicimonas sp. TH_r6]|uniref:hypothetical protein n=1 Tax=Tropicimonas sp. TH_r6 TaxID=3082085 RepID=UPI0029546877|nr:hypothetical protein [Tropicimonas sp. TH_r6]MDV7143527.1 hypothetical protein [Tropicimonas sp. TH_r6]